MFLPPSYPTLQNSTREPMRARTPPPEIPVIRPRPAMRLREQILSSQGIEVVSVTDGASALRRLVDADPDVLITDVFLPTKDGFDLARYIKAQPQLKRIRVIFAAGITDQFNEQDAKNAGADVILRKPFEASALLAAVQPLLEQAKTDRDNKEENADPVIDRKSTRLNSSHANISYAVFCLKK